jgi:hypothetical protein
LSSGEEHEEGGDGMVLLGGGSSNNTGRPLYLKWGVGVGGRRRPWRQDARLAATTQQHNKKGIYIGGRQSMTGSLKLPSHIFLIVE